MNIPLRYEARRQRELQEQAILARPRDRALFKVVKDGTRYSVWFYWNDDEPVLFLDRMTHLSSAEQMISEGKRRLDTNVQISVINEYAGSGRRKFV